MDAFIETFGGLSVATAAVIISAVVFFLKIVKGQLEKTEKNPNDYLWHSF